MKAKSRDYRKLERARRRYRKILYNTVGYSKKLLFADLNMKSVMRWFDKKHHIPLPKFGVNIK